MTCEVFYELRSRMTISRPQRRWIHLMPFFCYVIYCKNLGKKRPVCRQYFLYSSGNSLSISFSSPLITRCQIGCWIIAQKMYIQLFRKTANPTLKKDRKAPYNGCLKYLKAPVTINLLPRSFGGKDFILQIIRNIVIIVNPIKKLNRRGLLFMIRNSEKYFSREQVKNNNDKLINSPIGPDPKIFWKLFILFFPKQLNDWHKSGAGLWQHSYYVCHACIRPLARRYYLKGLL